MPGIKACNNSVFYAVITFAGNDTTSVYNRVKLQMQSLNSKSSD